MRLVFFGTPAFAVPSLERLADGPHTVVGVVCQPDRPRGRGRRVSPAPVARAAKARGLPLLRPERAGGAETLEALRSWRPDLGVVVAFGQFLPRSLRELPARGHCINGHASLLPRWRGAAPIARAILAGDARTGISVMRVEREMDAGPVALVRELEIGPEETAGELEPRLAALAADALAEAVERIADGRIVWREQDAGAVTLAPKIERADLRLDWSEPAAALARRVRALAPSPGARTTWGGEPLRVLAARTEGGAPDRAPGTVRRKADGELAVATGEGWLLPTRLQRAGGRPLDTASFLRGRDIPDWSTFL